MAKRKRCCVRRKRNGKCAKYKPPGHGKCLKPRGSSRKASRSSGKGGGHFTLGLGPAMRATTRMSCNNPARQARAIAISEYIWSHAAVERSKGVAAKGQRAVQSASKHLSNTIRTFERQVIRKCLPKSRGKRGAAQPRVNPGVETRTGAMPW